MTDKIEPALSAPVWAMHQQGADSMGLTLDQYLARHVVRSPAPSGDIAIANAALPDSDLRKITSRAVALLRDVADRIVISDGIVADDQPGADNDVDGLRTLAQALASYLPPEEP